METEIIVKTDLMIPAEKINILQLFSDKNLIESMIIAVSKKAREHNPDLSSESSRKAIASNAYLVSRTKTFLEKPAKDLSSKKKEALKKEIETIDGCRKLWCESLDSLRDEVRKPLTDWENSENERIEREKAEAEFLSDWDDAIHENDLFDRQREIERKESELRRQEEERKAKEEAERFERERKEREERIAKEAAEAAEKRAKAAEIEALWRSRLAQLPEASWNGHTAFDEFTDEVIITYEDLISMSDVEFEKVVSFRESQVEIRKEKEAQIAEQRKKEEQERIAKAAKEKAEREAAQKEAERIAMEKAAKEADERKARHHKHRKRIQKEAFESLVVNGIEEGCAQMVVELLDSGAIDHLTINY